ncbi:hypothetical protein F4820DRAFT_283384 [Hypoxylon rubiginosum]|uniref:Uncharacterized protein n=1 Tax=Hypoxylon rubiginosum TaxID=110542 RepID=A0ACB9Z1V2_9PEZI|nr:hypothetical protein F4820DRAFT_283384 [Hypoxylon rubiginosum]
MSPSLDGFRDDYSRIAMAGEGDGSSAGSLTQRRAPDPLLCWRAAPYQPFCRFHFLRECALYHLWENSHFKLMVDRLPRPTKSGKWPVAPTRVQPARRAREKNRKDQSEQAASSRTSSPAAASKSKDCHAALEARREQLQQHLPWPVYKTRLGDQLTQISERLLHQQEGDPEFHPNCPLGYKWRLGCRYCTFKSEVVDSQASVPRKLALPAPMYLIEPKDMREEQFGEFGGLTFAVDVCGEQEIVVLLEMKKLDDLAGEHVAEGGTTSSEKTTGSRKRDHPASPVKLDEEVSKRQKKRELG